MTLEHLIILVDSIVGADPLKASRARPVIDARTILVNALFAQGYTEQAVADMIGYARPTIHHYRELMRDAEKYGNNPEMLTQFAKLKNIMDL